MLEKITNKQYVINKNQNDRIFRFTWQRFLYSFSPNIDVTILIHLYVWSNRCVTSVKSFFKKEFLLICTRVKMYCVGCTAKCNILIIIWCSSSIIEIILTWSQVLIFFRKCVVWVYVYSRSGLPIPVAAWSKAWVLGRLLAGIAGSNPAGDMDLCLLWVFSVVRQRSLRRANHSSRGVLLNVVCVTVWSWRLDNEEVLA
jgi:hypothetical protein